MGKVLPGSLIINFYQCALTVEAISMADKGAKNDN